MSRKFPNFLAAYAAYADDKFVPPQFNVWAALSIIAGALDRKVWLPWGDRYSFYPNIYVLLVSKPGVGKSVALNNAVDLLREMNRRTSTINIMPSQVTEAKFIELMGAGRSFTDRSSGKELTVFQNSGYYFASEASNSLRNIFGEFIACLTDFYDCPSSWERATKSSGKIELKNVCMNILAGSTFDYLGKLVSDDNIQGGFASRLLYVVHDEKLVRRQKFQGGLNGPEAKQLRAAYREAMVADLTEINAITGPMSADAEFSAAWEAWYPVNEEKRQAFQSEKLQSIMARTNTNVIKLSILLSAAESNDRILRLRHWEQAVALVEGVNAHIPGIFREAQANAGPRAKSGNPLANLIIRAVQQGHTLTVIRSMAIVQDFNAQRVDATIKALIDDGTLEGGAAVAGQGVRLRVKGDPNKHL